MKKRVHIISNTHWDREWYMPLEAYRFRLVTMMDRLVGLMEEKPDYRFVTDGQYMLVEDYLAVRPEMAERVRALVKEGRLLVGPWYTQPLETLVTGEAMVRNLVYGIGQSEKLGRAMRFGYMVDEFGHASQMPQILQGFGIGHMLAWRGMPPELPPVFRWQSPDGTAVTMHRSVEGYGEATALPGAMEDFEYEFEGETLSRGGMASRISQLKELKERGGHDGVQFWLNGIDHSWAQEDILEIAALIGERYPEYSVRQSTLEEYAADLEGYYREEGVQLPSYTGELMYPDDVLQSTHSCRADHKLKHYEAEHLLEKYAEPMAAFAWLCGSLHADWGVKRAWKKILENHAHDSLGCCSVDSVYLQCMARYDSSISISKQLFENGFTYLMALSPSRYAVWIYYPNSTPAGGGAVVTLDIPEAQQVELGGFRLLDEKGGEIPYTVLGREKLMSTRYNPKYGHPTRVPCTRFTLAAALPYGSGIGLRRLTLQRTEERVNPLRSLHSPSGVMENRFLRVGIHSNGTIDLTDKRSGKRFEQLLLLEDSGECGNFYLHKRPLADTVVSNIGAAADIACLCDTEVLNRYRISYTIDVPDGVTSDCTRRAKDRRPLDVSLVLTLFTDRPRLDVQLRVVNRSSEHQLRLLFPTGIAGAKSASGQPFDIVVRENALPAGWDVDAEPSVACHPMQDFCAAFNGTEGLAVAAKGVFEYELTPANELALTLFRAVDYIDRFDENRLTGFETELAQLQKELSYELSILPCGGELPVAELQNFVHPPVAWYHRTREEALLETEPAPAPRELLAEPFIQISDPEICVTMVKKAERSEDLVVRLLNIGKGEKSALLKLSRALGGFGEIRTLTLNEEETGRAGAGNECTVRLKSRELLTLKFLREPSRRV